MCDSEGAIRIFESAHSRGNIEPVWEDILSPDSKTPILSRGDEGEEILSLCIECCSARRAIDVIRLDRFE